MPTASSVHSLDVRPLPHAERPARVFDMFDALGEGEGLILIADHEPRPLLGRFQRERENGFEWSVLEEGPEVWRLLITKRPGEGASDRSVHQAMQWDHERLDAMFERVRAAAGGGHFAEARAVFAEFRTGLRRHIRMEEEVLFPAFEAVSGPGGAGPCSVMRVEHIEISSILDRIGDLLAAEAPAGIEQDAAALCAVLSDHNMKEEHVVYPMTDRGLTSAERGDLIRRMQAL